MIKHPLMIAVLLSLSPVAFSQGYKPMKCPGLLEQIKKINPRLNEPFNAMEHLKAIGPKLGTPDEKNENQSFEVDMHIIRQKFIAKGVSAETLNLTRVERYRINGKDIDVLVYPDGVVHHMTNPLSNEDFDIIPVSNCKFNERDLGCIDPVTNKRIEDIPLCAAMKPENPIEFNPNCNDKAMEEYLATHNCLLESQADACKHLAALPKGVLGSGAGALAGTLIAKRIPNYHNGIKKIDELEKTYSELAKEAAKLNEAKKYDFATKRNTYLDTIKAKHAGNAPMIEAIELLQYRPPGSNLRSVVEYIKTTGQATPDFYKIQLHVVDSIDYEISQLYQKEVVNTTAKELIKKNTELNKYFKEQDFRHIAKFPDKTHLMINEPMMKSLFGSVGSQVAEIDAKAMADARGRLDFGGDLPRDSKELLRNKDLSRKILLTGKSLEVQALSELVNTRSTIRAELEPFRMFTPFWDKHVNIEAKNPKFSPRIVRAGAGVAGAMTGAIAEAGINWASSNDIKQCKNQFRLNDEEMNFLTHNGVAFAGSRAKSSQLFNPCDSLYMENPLETIIEARKKFGGIPKGICSIMLAEKNRLQASIEAGLKDLKPSCEDRKVQAKELSIALNGGNLKTEIQAKNGQGTFIYEASVTNNDSFPDFRTAQVYKLDAKGQKVYDAKATGDFLAFYKVIQGSIHEAGLKSTDESGNENMAERQRKYNAHMNKIYRSFSESCNGYGNIECEVFRKALNFTPVMHVTKSLCGNEVFDPKCTDYNTRSISSEVEQIQKHLLKTR